MLIKIFDAISEELLDTWQVAATYPIPNVGDRVEIKYISIREVRKRLFKKDVIVLYVSNL